MWDFVWLIENDVQPFNYPFGQIVEVFTGDDNKSRVAMARTANRTYKRAIVKLVPVDSDRKLIISEYNQKLDRLCCDQKI